MAVAATQLITAGSGTDGTSFATASFVPSNWNLLLLGVISEVSAGTANAPTLSGGPVVNGWTQVATVVQGVRTLTLFRGWAGPRPRADVVTIDFAGQTQLTAVWSVVKLNNVRFTGPQALDAVVQSATGSNASATSLTVTLAAFENAANATYGLFGQSNGAQGFSAGAGFTKLGDTGVENDGILSEFVATNDTTVDATVVGLAVLLGIAVEIRETPWRDAADADVTISVNETRRGLDYNVRKFKVNSGVTVTVDSQVNGKYLALDAVEIEVAGIIDGNNNGYAGSTGGAGGAGGSAPGGTPGGVNTGATGVDGSDGTGPFGGAKGTGSAGGAGATGATSGIMVATNGTAGNSGTNGGYNAAAANSDATTDEHLRVGSGGGGAGGGGGGGSASAVHTTSDKETGGSHYTDAAGGGGGGGEGGGHGGATIWLYTKNLLLSGTVRTKGAAGGAAGTAGGAGNAFETNDVAVAAATGGTAGAGGAGGTADGGPGASGSGPANTHSDGGEGGAGGQGGAGCGGGLLVGIRSRLFTISGTADASGGPGGSLKKYGPDPSSWSGTFTGATINAEKQAGSVA